MRMHCPLERRMECSLARHPGGGQQRSTERRLRMFGGCLLEPYGFWQMRRRCTATQPSHAALSTQNRAHPALGNTHRRQTWHSDRTSDANVLVLAPRPPGAGSKGCQLQRIWATIRQRHWDKAAGFNAPFLCRLFGGAPELIVTVKCSRYHFQSWKFTEIAAEKPQFCCSRMSDHAASKKPSSNTPLPPITSTHSELTTTPRCFRPGLPCRCAESFLQSAQAAQARSLCGLGATAGYDGIASPGSM